MKRLISTISLLAALISQGFAQAPVQEITGNITGTVNWSQDTIYKLKGKVYVKAGATLNIAPGTIIKGDKSTPGSALIITRGGKIFAVGTPTKPIVFTSSETPGNRTMGDWGGIAIAGNAKVNVPGGIGTFEGGNLANPDGTTSDGQYGGLNDLDNSGELKYVRIEYAGFAYAPNNELNSLTFGGVGSGTKISYIQCSYGLDDAFEWFGGTVSPHHLISFRGNDDDFDTDFGFSGKVQYGVCLRDTLVADAVSGANGFESDNDATGSANGPKTRAIFSNFTLVGPRFTATTTYDPNFRRGAHIRRNSEESVFNSVFMGWPTGIKIDGDSCHANADNGLISCKNNVIAGCPQLLDSTAGNTWNITPWYSTTGWDNTIYAYNTDLMLTNPFDYNGPNFRPSTGSPLLTGASFADAKLTGFETVTYRGAFGADDWTATWSNFRPDTSAYLYGYGVAPAGVTQHMANGLSMDIYPNPASGNFHVELPLTQATGITVTILDLTGKVIYSLKQQGTQGSNEISIPTASLSNGTYFVRVQAAHQTGIQKINIVR